VEAARAGFRAISLFLFMVLALLWCLIVNWYPQYKFTLAFSIKLGHMAFSLKNQNNTMEHNNFPRARERGR
jgi:hypothetical protein